MSGDPQFVTLAGLLVLAVLYVPVLLFSFQRSEGQEVTAGLVSAYAVLAMLWDVGEAFWRMGKLPGVSREFFQNIELFAVLILVVLAALILLTFLRHEDWWIWAAAAGIWILGLILISLTVNSLPHTIWSNGKLFLPRERLGLAWSLLGWLGFLIGGLIIALRARRQTRQPLLRNRLTYWLIVYGLIFANDVMILGDIGLPGNPLRLAAAILIAYVALTHNLPDVRQILRRVLVYVITTLLIVGFYVAGFAFSQTVFRAEPNFNPLLVGAIIALILALIFTPLLSLVRRTVDRWLRADQYDAGRALHEYSESISNILDMDRLAAVAVGIILDTMKISRAFLFLVDTGREADGQIQYRLRAARSSTERQIVAIQLNESGPIASYLIKEERPLLQYDLDLLPAYRSITPLEREWFRRLETEVYVPIFAKRKWIGLLAIGAKLSGNRFTEEDLVTLSALANQTAVALENARLVDNLMRLNTELRSARRALEKSNRDLERLDRTKSDFISIASHELRTPLTVIKGYTEMLLEDTTLDPNFVQVIRNVHQNTLRLHEIMDSMFNLAQIDARSMKLNLQYVDVGVLLEEVCRAQEKAIRERKQTITLNLPSLPRVKGDPHSLRKVFEHLVQNAIKFTPNDGRITITGHIQQVSTGDLPHGGIELIFSDTGIGVDPNYREIIFTKFYQPGDPGKHSTSKTRFRGGGSGLGLALSKGIVEAHGGRIWVESPGYDEFHFPGSQFHVILPLETSDKGDEITMTKNEVKLQVG